MMVSEISLGGSPVPPEPVFRRAIEMGVNYVDTSALYANGNSERKIGRIIKGRRDAFHVATKFHLFKNRNKKADIIKGVEKSLKRLQTDHVDVLMIHGAGDPKILENQEVLAAFAQLKKGGKIRFTGVSCHENHNKVLTPAIRSGNYDVITVAYNVYSMKPKENPPVYDNLLAHIGVENILALAKEHDVGVVAMKSMAGGAQQNLASFKKEGITMPQAKIKWVLQNDAVGTVISEMITFDILEENLSVSGSALSRKEGEILEKYVKDTSGDYCRMCGTCHSNCPAGVAIPDILRYAMYHEGYGKPVMAQTMYRMLPVHNTFHGCKGCGTCEAVCPYGLRVVQKLGHAHHLLA